MLYVVYIYIASKILIRTHATGGVGGGGGGGGRLSNDGKMTAGLHSPSPPYIDKALLCVTFLLLGQT